MAEDKAKAEEEWAWGRAVEEAAKEEAVEAKAEEDNNKWQGLCWAPYPKQTMKK